MLIYPVFIPQMGCKGQCIFCDQTKISGSEGFDWSAQLPLILDFLQRNHDKPRQVAFYGGSFTGLDQNTRESWLGDLLPFIDPDTSFRISTRPDLIDMDVLAWCRQWQITTIELGIQDFSDTVLRSSRRNYTSSQAIESCRLIQQSGIKLGIQLMPGLPGANPHTLECNKHILSVIVPDHARFYPTIVLKGTPLAELWQAGLYKPPDMETAIGICADYVKFCNAIGIKVIKCGLPSTIHPDDVLAGAYHPAFGEFVRIELLIRSIISKLGQSKRINLRRNEIILLRAHDHYGMKTLTERIAFCMLDTDFEKKNLTSELLSVLR